MYVYLYICIYIYIYIYIYTILLLSSREVDKKITELGLLYVPKKVWHRNI